MTRLPFSDVPAFVRDPLSFVFEKGSASTQALVPLRLGLRPLHLLTDAALVRDVLAVSEDVFAKGKFVARLEPLLGQASLTLKGEASRERRRILHEHLRQQALARQFPEIMAAVTRGVAEAMRHEGPLTLPSFAATLSLRIALRVLMGGEFLDADEEGRLMAAVRTVETDMAIGVWRMWPAAPWTLMAENRRRRDCLAEIESIVARVRRRATPDSVVGGLTEAGLTDGQMRDELVTLLIAGHETTGSALSWLLHHLALRPDIADQIAEEVDIASDWSGELTYPELRKLTVTEKVVRETLRSYPSSWWFSREAQQDTDLGGHRLRKGDNVIVSPWLLHRDPRWWGDDAATWNPDRAAPSVATAYIPYGTGARACIGMTLAQLELVAITAAFASACRMVPRSAADAKPFPTVTLRPDPTLAVEFLPREPLIVERRAIA